MNEESTKSAEVKKPTWKVLVAIILGVTAILLGGAGVIQNDAVNNTLIELGANQTASGAIELNHDLAPVFANAADVIDAAIEARETNPDKLIDLVNTAVKNYTTTDVSQVVSAAVIYINDAYKSSPTEEQYIVKLKHLSAGFKTASKVEYK